MRNLLIIVLALISLNVYGQRKQTIRELVVKDSLAIQAGNPDSNKIAVSVDANGKFKWVYFTDLQDSVNTAIYDTTTANVVVTQAIRITGAAFASDTLVSIGTSGTVTKCFATCDTIQYILDNLGGAQLWDSTGSNQSFVYPNPNTLGLWIGDTTGIKDAISNIEFAVAVQTGIMTGIVGTTGDTTVVVGFGTVGEGGFAAQVDYGGNTTSLAVRAGSLLINDGSAQSGYVFTATDTNGVATWQAPITYNGDTLVSGVATAGSFTMPNSFGGLILSGTGTAVTYTLTLPDTPTEGQKILITNNDVAITLLSFAGNGNTLSATLSAGIGMTTSGQRWVTFHNGTWY
jgi:hypothetical protein